MTDVRVEVLSLPNADMPGTSLLLHFDNKRYFIGKLPEGLQRNNIQMSVKLLKINEMFMTGRCEWRNTGGLLGHILTHADAATSRRDAAKREAQARAEKARKNATAGGQKNQKQLERDANGDTAEEIASLNLFTPPGVLYHLACARRYILRKALPVNVTEIDDNLAATSSNVEPFWKDANIQVWPLLVRPTTSDKSTHRPVNPRKRSYEEIESDNQAPSVAHNLQASSPSKDQNVLRDIVDTMFNSALQLDRLVEVRLADVKRGAEMFIRSPDSGKVEQYFRPQPGAGSPVPDPEMKVLVRSEPSTQQPKAARLPPYDSSSVAISYVIKGYPQRGKFDRAKAVALGVKPGKDYGKLATGESVENENGQTVYPEQVLGPQRDGMNLGIVDLPDPTYIQDFLARSEVSELKDVKVAIWLCDEEVMSDARIVEFIKSTPDIQHVIAGANKAGNEITFDSSATHTAKLANLDRKRFRVPVFKESSVQSAPSPNMAMAARGMVVQLTPAVGIKTEHIAKPFDARGPDTLLSEDVWREVTLAEKALARDEDSLRNWASTLPGKDVEITTLGTGSAQPSKHRNVSATLVRIPGWGNLLLDCGENTIGQLRRTFAENELKEILRDLKLVYISHMHADHHMGTIGVLKTWYESVHASKPLPAINGGSEAVKQLFSDRLSIIAPGSMHVFLQEYAALEDYGSSRLNLIAARRWYGSTTDDFCLFGNEENSTISPSLLGMAKAELTYVDHCSGATAVALTWPDGFKISYSGDCRPSKNFARIGAGSTVCIHEATFDDELSGDAKAKKHSTTSEALRTAEAMGARTCVLTHFSQRYQKMPELEKSEMAGSRPVILPDEPAGRNATDTINHDPDVVDVAGTDDMVIESAPVVQPARRGSNTVRYKLATDMKVCVAFDHMRVKVGEIAEMQYFTPALVKLFAEEGD